VIQLKCLAEKLASKNEPIPLGSLIVLFHVAAGIESNSHILRPRDREEARNYRVYHELVGIGEAELTNASISGSFKPPEFVHPFERHYSLPGYLDPPALSMLFSAVDLWAKKGVDTEHGRGFLSFLYMFFLLVHPFVDRNGRVARGLLDYYNKKLDLGVESIWHCASFKNGLVHKQAFKRFFENEAKLPPRKDGLDPYPIRPELRLHLGRMADYMVDWAAQVAHMIHAPKSLCDPFERQGAKTRSHIRCLKTAWNA